MLIHIMPRYRVVGNRIAIIIIHVKSYLTILGLIERELVNLNLTPNQRIQLRLAYIKFQQLFYSENSNGYHAV